MGILDKWLKSFLKSEEPRPGSDGDASAPPREGEGRGSVERAAPSDGPPPRAPVTPSSTSSRASSRASSTSPARASPATAASTSDPLDTVLVRARARLTADAHGRAFAESPELQVQLQALDGGGRSRAADGLLADALLVSPSLALRRQLAERLLHRGERAKARALLEKLVDHAAADGGPHSVFALAALGELAEAEGDMDEARLRYEQVLALDITQAQAKARARRLRAEGESSRGDDGRRVLARFLGARAAGARYAVVDEIGRGGAATVFRARDRVVDREVALKIFHARGSAADRRRRIREEARIAGSFSHPHVVPVLDLDEERDLLVMALCDGGSLQRRLSVDKKVRHAEALELGAVLVRTLADIHDAGHVHLDIKPSNVLFHEGLLMLCDFGTAGMRELGALAGTRAYMAPEHRDGGEAGPAADLYSAGLVVVECIEGRLPPAGQRPQLTSLPAGPRRRGLEEVLARLTAPNAASRPLDGRLAADLLLQAGALPLGDAEGAALHHHIESLAAREGDEAVARMRAHPLVSALRSP